MRKHAFVLIAVASGLLLALGISIDRQSASSLQQAESSNTPTQPYTVRRWSIEGGDDGAATTTSPRQQPDPRTSVRTSNTNHATSPIEDALRLEIFTRTQQASNARHGSDANAWTRLITQVVDWEKSPSRGSWREHWYPPANTTPPKILAVIDDRAAWDAQGYSLSLRPGDTPRDMLHRVIEELIAIPRADVAMEYFLDNNTAPEDMAYVMGWLAGNQGVMKMAPLALLFHYEPELARAAMAIALGGARPPSGPG